VYNGLELKCEIQHQAFVVLQNVKLKTKILGKLEKENTEASKTTITEMEETTLR
jgi:hypothetical protein